MKIKVILALLTVVVFGGAFAKAQEAKKAFDHFEIQVDGLGCPFCAYGLEKKFKEFKGIKKVAINIETGDFSFKYPAQKELSMQAVIAQVQKAGYTPITSKITRSNGVVEEEKVNTTLLTKESVVVSQQIIVAGKCDMCKARIENAALKITGVTEASYKVAQKALKVKFDQSQTTTDAIQQQMAAIGHDTKLHRATDESYDNLPACCHYNRLKE